MVGFLTLGRMFLGVWRRHLRVPGDRFHAQRHTRIAPPFPLRSDARGRAWSGCREAVGASSRYAAPALRFGPSGDTPPCTRRSAAVAVSRLTATGRSLDAGSRWGLACGGLSRGGLAQRGGLRRGCRPRRCSPELRRRWAATQGAGHEGLVKRADLESAVAVLRADVYRALWIQGAGIVAVVAALRFLPGCGRAAAYPHADHFGGRPGRCAQTGRRRVHSWPSSHR